MASLNSWLSETVLHALGWALIHSLWQCLAVAALAALVMAFCRRPSIRYIVAVGALALMLAAPVATFFLLRGAPVSVVLPMHSSISAAPVTGAPTALSVAISSPDMRARADFPIAIAREVSQARFLPPNVLPWLVGGWLFGVVFFSLRFAGGFLLLEHRCRSQSIAPSPRILAMCRELQRQLGLHRAIRYLECAWLQTPAVIGWLRPVVLLPVTALIGLSEEQLRAVIAHELAHIRRHDWLVNLFQILVETLLFYHPAMWWLNRRIRAERELACDEIAVLLSGNRLDYARALTLMAAWEKAPALAMAANRGSLSERIFHVLGRKPAGTGQRMLGLTGSVLFLAAALGAANALFGIAYPIPAAQAKQTLQAALPSSQVAVDPMARRTAPAGEPAAKRTTPNTDTIDRAAAAPDQILSAKQPEKLVPPSPDLSQLLPRESLVTPTVVASNVLPAAQASLNSPAATPAKTGPETATACRNSSVFGRVFSSKALLLQGFTCFADSGAVSAPGPHDMALGSCPLASTTSAHKSDCKWDVALNVQFADPADAEKMIRGKLVRLGGDFHLVRRDKADYLVVDKARILFLDYFWAASGVLPPALTCKPPELVALSRKIGRNLCVQNEILADLKTRAAALEAAARSPNPGQASADPDAISCRGGAHGAATNLNCAYNVFWAANPQTNPTVPEIGPFYSGGYGGGFNGGPDPSISPNASSPCGQCGVHF